MHVSATRTEVLPAGRDAIPGHQVELAHKLDIFMNNSHPLEAVNRVSETQLQVGEYG